MISFILAGSCGVEYSVHRVRVGSTLSSDDKNFTYFGMIAFLCVALYFVFRQRQSSSPSVNGNRFHGRSGGGGDRPDSPDDPPPPYSEQPPPSFQPFSKSRTESSNTFAAPSTSSSGLGFWPGLGLGAALGYLGGSRGSTTRSSYYNTESRPNPYPPASSSSSPPETHISTGYGSTRRR
jgi:hypothetical protein